MGTKRALWGAPVQEVKICMLSVPPMAYTNTLKPRSVPTKVSSQWTEEDSRSTFPDHDPDTAEGVCPTSREPGGRRIAHFGLHYRPILQSGTPVVLLAKESKVPRETPFALGTPEAKIRQLVDFRDASRLHPCAALPWCGKGRSPAAHRDQLGNFGPEGGGSALENQKIAAKRHYDYY